MKQCLHCKREGLGPKPLSEFNKGSDSDGLQNLCRDHSKAANRAWVKRNPEKNRAKGKRFRELRKDAYREIQVRTQLKSVYGLSESDYANLFSAQDGKCAICGLRLVSRLGKTFSKGQGHAPNEVARVDHCHETNKVRGLLCFSCNVGLGKFRDDETLLLSAVRYLRNATAQADSREHHETVQGERWPLTRDPDRTQADERPQVISLNQYR